MPHLILEFSANISEKDNMINLFKKLHPILEKTLPTDIVSCKSRAIECADYYIGNSSENNAFIHVTLKIMPGRDSQTLKNLGNVLLEELKKYFADSLENLKLQITLEIMALEDTYFKVTSE